MKQLFIIAILSVIALSSCTGDEANDYVDSQYLNSITRGETTTTYILKSEEEYKKLDESANYVRVKDMVGGELPGSDIVIFHNGKSCTPLILFYESFGSHPLAHPLDAYRKKTGFTGNFYVTSRMEYDENTNKMTVGQYVYDVQSASKSELVLVHYSRYVEGATGKKGTYKVILHYEVRQVEVSLYANSYFYETDYDAYLGLLNLIRDELGSVINVNEYLAPAFEYDDPIYDLDEIEAKLKEDLNYWLKWENRIKS